MRFRGVVFPIVRGSPSRVKVTEGNILQPIGLPIGRKDLLKNQFG